MEGNGKPTWLDPHIWNIMPPDFRARVVPEEVMASLPETQRTLLDEYIKREINEFALRAIGKGMKEVPIMKSEIPPADDIHQILNVEYPAEGGIKTFMKYGEKVMAFNGFPLGQDVEKVDIMKKISRALMSGLFHALKKQIWLLPTLLPAFWIFKKLVYVLIYTFHRLVERVRIKPNMYCPALRELYRAFSKPRLKEDQEMMELRLMLRDLLCMTMEFDNAYRFRFQDLVESLNKDNLRRKPIKELLRLFSLAQSREKTQEINDTWKLVKLGINFYLRFNPKLTNLIKDTLLEVDIEKVKLSSEDKSFCDPRKDYIFGYQNVRNS